jgi:hypothetical protein
MAAIQRPVWYPPTVMDREAAQILAIRVRTRPAVNGGTPGKWITPTPASAGSRVPSAQVINGGAFSLRSGDKNNFA